MRAYSIDGNANPLGGLLRIGDHVDVLLETRGEATLLLEQVLVLAVGGQLKRVHDEEKAPVRASGVTLSVTSAQAEELLVAESAGDLRLVLRNPEDLHRVEEGSPGDPKSAPSAVRTAARQDKKEIEHVR
jgi:pilus assembly protein CpaB